MITYGHGFRKIRDPIFKPLIIGLLVVALLASLPMAAEGGRPRQARPLGPACRFPTVHCNACFASHNDFHTLIRQEMLELNKLQAFKYS